MPRTKRCPKRTKLNTEMEAETQTQTVLDLTNCNYEELQDESLELQHEAKAKAYATTSSKVLQIENEEAYLKATEAKAKDEVQQKTTMCCAPAVTKAQVWKEIHEHFVPTLGLSLVTGEVMASRHINDAPKAQIMSVHIQPQASKQVARTATSTTAAVANFVPAHVHEASKEKNCIKSKDYQHKFVQPTTKAGDEARKLWKWFRQNNMQQVKQINS